MNSNIITIEKISNYCYCKAFLDMLADHNARLDAYDAVTFRVKDLDGKELTREIDRFRKLFPSVEISVIPIRA